MSTYALQMLVNAVPGATGAVPYWNASTRLWNTLAMGSALQVLRVNAGGTALEFAAPSGGSAQWESTGGYFRAKPAELATGDYFLFTSKVANSGSNVAFVFDTDTTLSGSTRLATFKNNTSERLYIDDEGNIRFGTGMADNSYRSVLQADALAGLYVGSVAGQTVIALTNNLTSGMNLYIARAGYGYIGFGSPYGYTGSVELGGVGSLASLDGQCTGDNPHHGGSSTGDSGFKKSAATGGNMDFLYDNTIFFRHDGTSLKHTSPAANSGTNVAHIFDTGNALTGTTLLASFRNNGSEKFALADNGAINAGNGAFVFTPEDYGTGADLDGALRVGHASYGIISFGGFYSIGLKHSAGSVSLLWLDSGDFAGTEYDWSVLATKKIVLDATAASGVGLSRNYTAGDSGFSKSAATDGVMLAEYDGVPVWLWSDKVNTTNAAGTTLWSTTLSDNNVHGFEVTIVARRTDAAGRWYGSRRGVFYREGGAPTQEGTTEVIGTDVASGITPGLVDFDISSNDVRVRVQGEVGKNISWRCYVRKIHMN